MGCCGGSSSAKVIIQAKNEIAGIGGNGDMSDIDPSAEIVRMEYFGPRVGAVTYFGRRKHYRFGNNAVDRYQDVNPEDVETLLRQPGFRIVGRDLGKYQPPEVDFVPEPSGDYVPEPVNEFVPEFAPEGVEVIVDESPEEIPVMDDDEWEKAISDESPELAPMPSTAKEIKKEVMKVNMETLISWLKEEQSGKKRKTAIEAIEQALEERF